MEYIHKTSVVQQNYTTALMWLQGSQSANINTINKSIMLHFMYFNSITDGIVPMVTSLGQSVERDLEILTPM